MAGSSVVALVSGGAGGIGAAIVSRLVASGLAVASVDLAQPPAVRPGVVDLVADITDPDQVAAAVAALDAPPLVVVHCAAYEVLASFTDLAVADWDRTFRVNVTGALHLLQATVPAMRLAGWGRIVLITSSSQFAPPPRMSHYIASKGALTGLARGLATELGPDGITVNAVAPGLTATEKALRDVSPEHFAAVRAGQAVPRTGLPEDTAGAVAYLVSREAGFVTGQTLLVDGGESRL